ncbi:hypothetical protein DID75_01705 [Candidatus Marinamargulisbacteria bacterium SCGC AG-410-N11]|nr:hypothetical protein DID75_01705 [Candidatus Marinamargulisbacteria bacterium SCGC AG-410-N11]
MKKIIANIFKDDFIEGRWKSTVPKKGNAYCLSRCKIGLIDCYIFPKTRINIINEKSEKEYSLHVELKNYSKDGSRIYKNKKELKNQMIQTFGDLLQFPGFGVYTVFQSRIQQYRMYLTVNLLRSKFYAIVEMMNNENDGIGNLCYRTFKSLNSELKHFSYETIQKICDRYRFSVPLKPFVSGGFKHCFKSTDSKVVLVENLQKTSLKVLKDSIKLSKKLGSDITPQFYRGVQHGSYFISEYQNGGQDLFEFISSNFLGKPDDFSLRLKKYDLILKLINLVKQLNEKHYIHPDLKLENIVIDSNGKLRLIDLDWIFEVIGNSNYLCDSGTLLTMAPETYFKNKICFKSQIYSLGAMIYTILCSEMTPEVNHLFYRSDSSDSDCEDSKTLDQLDSKIRDHSPVEFQKVLKSMFCLNPKKRPSFGDVFNVIETIMHDRSACKLQTLVHIHKARKDFDKLKLQRQSARTIQTAYRDHAQRRKVMAMRYDQIHRKQVLSHLRGLFVFRPIQRMGSIDSKDSYDDDLYCDHYDYLDDVVL